MDIPPFDSSSQPSASTPSVSVTVPSAPSIAEPSMTVPPPPPQQPPIAPPPPLSPPPSAGGKQPIDKKIIISIILFIATVGIFGFTILLRQNIFTTQGDATGSNVPSCPSGTESVFSTAQPLSNGTTVNFSGKVTAISGSNWRVELQNSVLMAEGGTSMTITFPEEIFMDTVLVYDNDPKSGERPWSINGISLPTTLDNTWAPAFTFNKTAKELKFDNGGDSPHFNVCAKKPVSPSKTPTPTATKTPSPTPTNSVTPVPSVTPTSKPSISPTPTVCPKPGAVTNMRISCPLCQ